MVVGVGMVLGDDGVVQVIVVAVVAVVVVVVVVAKTRWVFHIFGRGEGGARRRYRVRRESRRE